MERAFFKTYLRFETYEIFEVRFSKSEKIQSRNAVNWQETESYLHEMALSQLLCFELPQVDGNDKRVYEYLRFNEIYKNTKNKDLELRVATLWFFPCQTKARFI